MQPLNVNKDFHIFTDASFFGIGFAVFQPSDEDGNILKVVGYGGNSLNQHQKY